MQGPRVAIVGVWLESNRQAPVAGERDFTGYYCLEGAAILEGRANTAYDLSVLGAATAVAGAVAYWQFGRRDL